MANQFTSQSVRMRKISSLSRAVAFVTIACMMVCGCQRSGTKLEEKSFPNPLVSPKKISMKGETFADDKEAFLRSSKLTFAQANTILNGFRYTSSIKYNYARTGKRIVLQESFSMTQRQDGAFRAKLKNNRKKGYEVLWDKTSLYWRDVPGQPFRKISKDIQQAYRWQQRGFGRWRSLVEVFGAQLQLKKEGSCENLARTCRRYSILLTKKASPLLKKQEGTAWSGTVPKHTKGPAEKEKRQLKDAKGTLWIDKESGLALQVEFKGHYLIGSGRDQVDALISLQSQFTHKGDSVIKTPKDISNASKEPEPLNPFAKKIPPYLQPPPGTKKRKK